MCKCKKMRKSKNGDKNKKGRAYRRIHILPYLTLLYFTYLNFSLPYSTSRHLITPHHILPYYISHLREFEVYMEEVKKMPGIMGQGKRDVCTHFIISAILFIVNIVLYVFLIFILIKRNLIVPLSYVIIAIRWKDDMTRQYHTTPHHITHFS